MKTIPRWKHWWYKLTEPTGHGRLFAMGPKRFVVQYREGRSIPMAYDVACDYAEMFDGTVHRRLKSDWEICVLWDSAILIAIFGGFFYFILRFILAVCCAI